MLDNLQRLFNRRNRPAWLVLLICLALTFLAWHGLRTQAEKDEKQQFELYVRDVLHAIENRMRQHEQILRGGAGLFDASTAVSRAEWHAYIERLNLAQAYPGILGVGFSQVIRPAELKAHIAKVRQEGFPHYTVRPSGERALYTSIVYLEPFAGRNLVAFGFDMLSEATRARAMRASVEGNTTTITRRVTLIQDTHGKEQPGFLMYLPVFRKGLPLATAAERWAALQGFVYSPYRVGDLMDGILGKRALQVNFSIFDGAAEDEATRIYASTDALHAEPAGLSVTRALNIYGNTWTVRLDSRPEFESGFQSPLLAIILMLGGSISVLLFVLVSFLIFRRDRAEELAQKMTEEIRRNEERLRLNEARLSEGQRIARIGSWELDLLSGELNWSDEIFRLFEIDKNRFPATYEGFLNAIHPEDRDAVNQAYSDSLANRLPYEITHRLLMRDGRIKWVQERCTTEFDDTGKPLRSRGTVQDVTERKVAEDGLRQTQFLLDSIIENIPTMVFLKRADDLRFELFNRAGEQILGYRREDLLGKNDYDFFPQEQADFFTAADREVLASREVLEIREEPVNTASGETRILQTWKIALRDARGEPTYLLGMSMDITDRKSNEVRLAAILDNVLDGIITIDERGIIESFNRAAENIFGYRRAEVIGNNIKMLMPEPYRSQHDGYLGNYAATGIKKVIGIGRQMIGQRKDDSTFPMELSVSEMRLGDKRMFTGIVRDITERVKIDRMKSEFISIVSHELRTPLTSIRGSLGLIAGGVVGALPAQAKALVDIAHKNSERLILLVNDILDMEKIEAGKMEFNRHPVKLMPLLKQALEANRPYAEQYQVSYELAGDLPEVMANVDPNRLMQVLANLLSNAAKFSPAGGRVTLAITVMGQLVRIAVQDHGSGIPKQFQERIFQKFAQADASDTRKKGGTGLGLAITRAIVEQMGGSIGFDSEPDVLTTFFIDFPLWQEDTVTAAPVASLEWGNKTSGKRVLICEDDPDIAALLRLMLEQAGLAADITYDAAQARAMLLGGDYAALTLDLGLPDQDGIALIRELRSASKTAALPILVVSARAAEGRKELNGEAFTVLDWISKPINQEQLVAALMQAVGQIATARPHILHVEDDADVIRVVNAIVGEAAEVESAPTLAAARRLLQAKYYNLVILDISLPDGSGMELLPILNRAEPPIPVLVFSSHEMAQQDMQEVNAALVKSRTDNAQLLAAIKRLVGVQ